MEFRSDSDQRTIVSAEKLAEGLLPGTPVKVEHRVVGATGINAPREVRDAQAMIRAGKPVDPVAVADSRVQLQRLVAATR